jgi:hypothetical protein
MERIKKVFENINLFMQEGKPIIVEQDGMKINLNLVKDYEDKRDFQLTETVLNLESKLTKKKAINWTKYMSPVKDQGRLGSCVGFAVAAMKEFQEHKEHIDELAKGKRYRRKKDHYDLSEAWVYWNCKKIDPWPNSEGTSIRCAMKVLHKIGIPCEAGWEYDDRLKGKPKSWAHLIAKWGLIDSYYRVTNLSELKTALLKGPVVIGVGCYEEITRPDPKTGLVPYPKNPNNLLGGHAICAVGFNDNQKIVRFKNSWGKGWGKNGYGQFSYDYIRDFMWDAWAAKDMSVTRKIIKEHDGELI